MFKGQGWPKELQGPIGNTFCRGPDSLRHSLPGCSAFWGNTEGREEPWHDQDDAAGSSDNAVVSLR